MEAVKGVSPGPYELQVDSSPPENSGGLCRRASQEEFYRSSRPPIILSFLICPARASLLGRNSSSLFTEFIPVACVPKLNRLLH
ncbi:hypothetical protein TNCT_274751 [Trichonephila clavata]|uniref:Uncharacterized protein n=1 Tax=Trichonephila clavata TaxID=2740835 RepID=A0A8X6KXJ8_TRICU|nr:hypothetical protein TNCT_274751 [Trichonephila clavata]